jgi:3-oxoacyl-[acyl-carrier-protein] synthase II
MTPSSSDRKRVVITGVGVSAPNGVGTSRFWESLVAGRTGIGPITAFDASEHCSQIAGQVDDLDVSSISKKVVKRSARFVLLSLVASQEALAQSGLTGEDELERVAVVIGSGIGGFEVSEREHKAFVERGVTKFHPLTVPMIIPNMAAGTIAMETGCRGPNMCVTTACASGTNSIGTALDLIRNGRADAALAGGAESTISPSATACCAHCRRATTHPRPHRVRSASTVMVS